MKKVIFLFSVLFIVGFALSAQQASSENAGPTISFSDLKSMKAQSTDNQLQGNIADLVLANNGEVRYLAVQANQTLGSANQGAADQNTANQGTVAQGEANQLYLVPPHAGKADFAKKTITYDITADQMGNIPTVSMSDLESGKGDWKTNAQNYWQGQSLGSGVSTGEALHGEEGGTSTLLASKLMKYQLTDVNGGNQQPITELYFNRELDDLVGVSINPRSGSAGETALGSGAYNNIIPISDPVHINAQKQTIQSNMLPEAFTATGGSTPPEDRGGVSNPQQ